MCTNSMSLSCQYGSLRNISITFLESVPRGSKTALATGKWDQPDTNRVYLMKRPVSVELQLIRKQIWSKITR